MVSYTTCPTAELQALLLHGAEQSRHFGLMAYLFLQSNPPIDSLSNRHYLLLQSVLSHAANVKRSNRTESVALPQDPQRMTAAELVAELAEAGVGSASPTTPAAGDATQQQPLVEMVRSLRMRKDAVGVRETYHAVAAAVVKKKAYQLFQAEVDFMATLNKIGETLQAFEPDKRSAHSEKSVRDLQCKLLCNLRCVYAYVCVCVCVYVFDLALTTLPQRRCLSVSSSRWARCSPPTSTCPSFPTPTSRPYRPTRYTSFRPGLACVLAFYSHVR